MLSPRVQFVLCLTFAIACTYGGTLLFSGLDDDGAGSSTAGEHLALDDVQRQAPVAEVASSPADAAGAPDAGAEDDSVETAAVVVQPDALPEGETAAVIDAASPPEVTADVAPPSPAGSMRLQIEAIGIDAPVVSLGVEADGTMQSPSGPLDAGWYTFSAIPGAPGNAVFSGHVDFANFGPAVFWRLRQLGGGEVIRVRGVDGSTYEYVVTQSRTYDPDDAPLEEIIGATSRESITLITCEGDFNARTRQYDLRLVIRAERI
jgi:LPXTG-site transpeptidase (sortase) family protein